MINVVLIKLLSPPMHHDFVSHCMQFFILLESPSPPISTQFDVLPLHFTPDCGRPSRLCMVFCCYEDITSYDKQLFGASVESYGRLTEDHPACTMITHYNASAHKSCRETARPTCSAVQSDADVYWSSCWVLIFAKHLINQATETSEDKSLCWNSFWGIIQ